MIVGVFLINDLVSTMFIMMLSPLGLLRQITILHSNRRIRELNPYKSHHKSKAYTMKIFAVVGPAFCKMEAYTIYHDMSFLLFLILRKYCVNIIVCVSAVRH